MEIDLLLRKGSKMYGVECKRQDAPQMNVSLTTTRQNLKLERIAVVYPGDKKYSLASRVIAVPFSYIQGGMKKIFS